MPIQKVAVIGAGVMGAGIAAHIANAGVPVILMDIVPKDATKDNRTSIAQGAIEKLKKSNPAALMHPKNANLITPANTEDDMSMLAECDWIIEAVIERLDIKQALYAKIAKVRKKGAIVSSNTSTLPLENLLEGQSKDFAGHFLITHFFNPPRYMRLLELVTSPATKPDVVETITAFADHSLGKSVVPCYDRPGFIANRIGTYWLHAATVHAIADDISVEAADAVLGKPFGVPKTGIFGLLDLVGLDLMPHVLGSLFSALPKADAFHKLGPAPQLLSAMIERGWTGRKAKAGFYRVTEKKEKQVINLQTGQYEALKKPKPAALAAFKKNGLKALLTDKSPEGQYAAKVMLATMAYAAHLVGEIAPDLESIDRAMRLGYNWKFGPLELVNKLGANWVAAQLTAQGIEVPKLLTTAGDKPLYKTEDGTLKFMQADGSYTPVPRPQGVLLLEDIKRRAKPLMSNLSASIWDAGDGVAVFEFHSKMNSLNPFILMLMNKAVKKLPGMGFKGMVIYNEGSNFSVGANIGMLLVAAKLFLQPLIRLIVWHGQTSYKNLKYADFPVVAAPANMALGGGCECILHSHAVVAHAESYIGLVEVGVGIVPGWGGCKELLGRAARYGKKGKGPMPPVVHAFETIATAKVAKSAAEARDLHFLTPTDVIVMNRERVLATAKAKALELARNFKKPEPFIYTLPGAGGLAALKLALHDFKLKGLATPHDVTVGTELAHVLTGGADADPLTPLTEDDLIKLERHHFMRLTRTRETIARVSVMLKTGKPLRN